LQELAPFRKESMNKTSVLESSLSLSIAFLNELKWLGIIEDVGDALEHNITFSQNGSITTLGGKEIFRIEYKDIEYKLSMYYDNNERLKVEILEKKA
jgi:hypothetical protein